MILNFHLCWHNQVATIIIVTRQTLLLSLSSCFLYGKSKGDNWCERFFSLSSVTSSLSVSSIMVVIPTCIIILSFTSSSSSAGKGCVGLIVAGMVEVVVGGAGTHA